MVNQGVNFAPVKQVAEDGEYIGFGKLKPFGIGFDNADGTAQNLRLSMGTGSGSLVPVFVLGISLAGRSLGTGTWFNSFTEPFVGVVDADRDTYVGFHFSADDTPVVRLKVTGTAVRSHTIPNVASDTIALIAASQVLTNKEITTGTLVGVTTIGTAGTSGTLLGTTWRLHATSTLIVNAGADLLVQGNGTSFLTVNSSGSGTVLQRMLVSGTSTFSGPWLLSGTGTISGTPTVTVPIILADAVAISGSANSTLRTTGTLTINGSTAMLLQAGGTTFINVTSATAVRMGTQLVGSAGATGGFKISGSSNSVVLLEPDGGNPNILGVQPASGDFGVTIHLYPSGGSATSIIRLLNSSTLDIWGGLEIFLTGTSGSLRSVTSGTGSAVGTLALNFANAINLQGNGTTFIGVRATGLGFFGATPIARPDVVGSRGTTAALAALLTALATGTLGLIIDSST